MVDFRTSKIVMLWIQITLKTKLSSMTARSILEPGVKARSRAGTINNPKKRSPE